MTLTLGPVRIDRVAELDHWAFPATEMFPGIGPQHTCCGEVVFTITTHVVRTPDLVVLVDAGNGNDKHRPVLTAHHGFATNYLDRLAAIGVQPGDVDVVVATHLHPDHCGGATRLVNGRWVPTFSRARHVVARAELAWLTDLAATKPPDGAAADLARTYADSVAPLADAGLLETVNLPHQLTDGVVLRALPGHTAGHLVVEVTGGGHTALITGDAIHHPLQFGDLDLAHSGDADPALAAHSRQALVAAAADTGAVLLPAHFGGPSGGHVRRIGEGFTFLQL